MSVFCTSVPSPLSIVKCLTTDICFLSLVLSPYLLLKLRAATKDKGSADKGTGGFFQIDDISRQI